MSHSPHGRGPSLAATAATLGMLLLFAVGVFALLALVVDDDDRETPRCPAVVVQGGNFVPAGPRPCLLRGSGSAAADGITIVPPTGRSGPAPRERTAPRPPAPKAPTLKVPTFRK